MEIKSRAVFEQLKSLPFFKGVIMSDSMSPLIKVGDKIVVEVGSEGLQQFDIIVFWKEGDDKLTCHYLWSINKIVTPVLYQTRALKTGDRDHPIPKECYLGKVVSHRLSLGHKLKILLSQIFTR